MLKNTYEPLARELNDKAKVLSGAREVEATELAKLFNRMFVVDEHGTSFFRGVDGRVVDVAAKQRDAERVLQGKEADHGD